MFHLSFLSSFPFLHPTASMGYHQHLFSKSDLLSFRKMRTGHGSMSITQCFQIVRTASKWEHGGDSGLLVMISQLWPVSVMAGIVPAPTNKLRQDISLLSSYEGPTSHSHHLLAGDPSFLRDRWSPMTTVQLSEKPDDSELRTESSIAGSGRLFILCSQGLEFIRN